VSGPLWTSLPDEWRAGQVKNAATVTLGKMLQSKDSGGDVRAAYMRAANVQPDGVLALDDVNEMWFSGAELEQLSIRAGDVVVVEGGQGGFGRAAYVRGDIAGWGFQNSINRLRPISGVDGRFLAFYMIALRASGFIRAYSNVVSMPHLTAEKLARIPTPLPPVETQRSIADYLDRETDRIDTLVEEQQRLIELLRERRRSLVTRAVCLGVDESVELRDSGDPVVGPVPAHWTVKAVRWWLASLDGQRVPLSAEERGDRIGDFDYYGASGVIDCVDDYLFDEPLVLVSEDGANLLLRSTPIAFAAKGRYWVNNHAHVLRPLGGGDVDYWAQRLEAVDVTTVVSGSAQPKLTAGALMSIRVSAPEDVDEQRQIAAYLDEQTTKIDALIAESERFVELSQERRSALITAAVTGQIDVLEMA